MVRGKSEGETVSQDKPDYEYWPKVSVGSKPMYEEPQALATQRLLKILALIGALIGAWYLWR